MKKTLAILACLILSPLSMQFLSAEALGNIEYHLPQDGKGWKTLSTPPNLQGHPHVNSIAIWLPEDATPQQNKEVFVVHRVPSQADLKDATSLKEGIERGMRLKYANPIATLTTLEETPDSIVYEFSVTDSDQEKEHGWIRAFTTQEGTTMLTYHTELVDNVGEKRDLWLKTLKEAKVTSSPEN